MVTWQSCTTEGAYTKQQQLGCKMNAGKQRKALAPDSTTDKFNEYGYILRVQYSGQSTVPSQEHVRIYSPCCCRSLSKQLTGTIDPRDQPLHLCSIRYISKLLHFGAPASISRFCIIIYLKIKCSDLSDTGLIVFPWNNEVWEQIAVCRLHMRTWLFTEHWECLEVAVVILPDINKSESEMPWRGEH